MSFNQHQHVNESPINRRSGCDDVTTYRETCNYNASSVPLPFCVDVVCLGTQATGVSSVYGGNMASSPSSDSNDGRCCASYVLTVDGAPLVLFGAGHGVVKEYLHTFGGLMTSSSPSASSPYQHQRQPPTAMLPPFIFIPSNTSSAAAELPTLLSVERGKQKALFEQHLPHNHTNSHSSDDDDDSATSSSPTLTSTSSSSSDLDENTKIKGTINKSKSDNVFRITVIAEKGVSESLEHHRLAEVRDLMLQRMSGSSSRRDSSGGSTNTLDGNLCNFLRLGISLRSAVIQTALPHAPRGGCTIATNTLVSEGYMTPVFRATLGANPLTSTFLRTAATKLVLNNNNNTHHHSNARDEDGGDWLFKCDAYGNYPIVGSVTDVLLISCVGIDGQSSTSSRGTCSGSCGMTLWHERVGTASRNVHFNINDQTIQSKLRKAKTKLKRRRVKCAKKRAELEGKLMRAVKAYASAVAASQMDGAMDDDDDDDTVNHLIQMSSATPTELLATVVSIRKELAILSSDEKRLNAIDNAEVERWSSHYEEVLVPRRPLLTISGDAAFSTNLMEELFLAQPPTTTTSTSSPFDTSSGGGGTALDISSSTHHHHHHHHGGAADGGASSEVFILPCKPDISSMSGNHNINRHHQHFNPQYQQLPYTDFYPDTVTHPFENNAPDVARQAASLFGAVRKVTDDAVNKVVNAAAQHQQQHETRISVGDSGPTAAAQPPQQVTVEEARQRLVTKQGSPTELRMYRRLLLVGKDPLTTTIPDGSFFAGDSKVVKVIPGSITTEMVTVNVLVEKSVPAASNAPAAGIDEGEFPSSAVAGAVTAAPSMTSGDTPSDKPIIHWSGGSHNNNNNPVSCANTTSSTGVEGGQSPHLPPPSFNPSSAANSSVGGNDKDGAGNNIDSNNLSVAEIIGWSRGSGRGRAKSSAGNRLSETSLTQWLSMFKQACIESTTTLSSPLSEARVRFIHPRVFLGHHHSGSSIGSGGGVHNRHYHHSNSQLPQDSPSLGISVVVPGAFITVTGEPYLSTTMLALREATDHHSQQHQHITQHSSHQHTVAAALPPAPPQVQQHHQTAHHHDAAEARGTQYQQHQRRAVTAESLTTPTPSRGATITSPTPNTNIDRTTPPRSPHLHIPPKTIMSNTSTTTTAPEGIIQSPRPTTTTTASISKTTPATAVRQTKRVFFYSNENLSQRPKLLMVPYLLDPNTEREYSQDPEGEEDGRNNIIMPTTTPLTAGTCSIAVLKQRVGSALGFPPAVVVDRLYLIQSPPPLTKEHELLSSSSLLSTPTQKTHPRHLVGVEMTSVTQIPPNSSVVVTRMGGYGFDPTRLPYLLRTSRDGNEQQHHQPVHEEASQSSYTATRAEDGGRHYGEAGLGLVLNVTPPPTATNHHHHDATSLDAMMGPGRDTSNAVVLSPPPSSRFSVQLRPMS